MAKLEVNDRLLKMSPLSKDELRSIMEFGSNASQIHIEWMAWQLLRRSTDREQIEEAPPFDRESAIAFLKKASHRLACTAPEAMDFKLGAIADELLAFVGKK